MITAIQGIEGLRALQGVELPPSPWVEVDQERINAFAEGTEDWQWIHVDVERAAIGPFESTIAHGFLTLSLIPYLWEQTVRLDGFRMIINYGVNRVRFPAPVPSGSLLRARFEITEITEVEGGVQVQLLTTVEREAHTKPVCVAELLLRFYE